MPGSPWANLRIGFYATGVAFYSPGAPRYAAHPGYATHRVIQTPTGFYKRTIYTVAARKKRWQEPFSCFLRISKVFVDNKQTLISQR
jgi:hypothetical protein